MQAPVAMGHRTSDEKNMFRAVAPTAGMVAVAATSLFRHTRIFTHSPPFAIDASSSRPMAGLEVASNVTGVMAKA